VIGENGYQFFDSQDTLAYISRWPKSGVRASRLTLRTVLSPNVPILEKLYNDAVLTVLRGIVTQAYVSSRT
jgi:hypothetical protein